MTTIDPGAPALFRAIGLQPDGPALLGRPIRSSGPGVYVVELATPLATPPFELTRLGKWIEDVPTLRLDGERPTSKALAARLASFWLPSRRVLFIGAAETAIASRVAALDRHVLGARRPHAAAHWLKTLQVDGLRVWWAETKATEEYEDALLGAFAESVPPAEAATLPDADAILPWANLRDASGRWKRHGLSGSVPPAEPVIAGPTTHVVELPPGDADGARVDPRKAAAARRAAAPRKAVAPRAPREKARTGRPADPVLLSGEGLEALQAEHAELLGRRPEIVGRIRTAKELGDLKENSDYTSAREEQSFLEGRIQAIEAQLRAAVVIDAPTGDRITVGTAMTVEIDGLERRFTIVGTTESDPQAGRISYQSPIGRAIMGRSAGDEVVVTTPGGDVIVRVLSIE